MRKTNFLLNVSLLIALLSTTVFADINRFVGRWENVNTKTRGIVSIDITREGDKITVQPQGKCHPTPCVWKKSEAVVYTTDVESDLLSNATSLSAIFNPGFAEEIVTLRMIGENKLQADVFTRYTDRSKRSNTFYTEIFSLKRNQ